MVQEMFRHSSEVVELFLLEVFEISVCLSLPVKHASCDTLLPVSVCLLSTTVSHAMSYLHARCITVCC